MGFFTLDKSTDSELENAISYTTVEEQWNMYSALKVDKLVTPLLRKWPLNILVRLLESSSLSSDIKLVDISSLVVQNSITGVFNTNKHIC